MKKLLVLRSYSVVGITILFLIFCSSLNCAEMSLSEKLAQLSIKKADNQDYEFKELVTLKHEAPVNTAAWSTDDCLIASGSNDGIIKIWNKKGKLLQEIDLIKENHPNLEIHSLKWSKNNRFLAVGCINTIIIIDLKKNLLYGIGDYFLLMDEQWYMDEHRSPNYCWEITGKLEGFNGIADSIAWSDDSTFLASSYNHTILIWDIITEKQIQKIIMPGRIRSITWAPDAQALGIIIVENVRGIYDLKNKKLQIIPFSPYDKDDRLFSVIPKERTLDTYTQTTYFEHGYIIRALAINNLLNCICHTSDEEFLAAGYEDGTLKILQKVMHAN
jgi:WD40 repeat protein